MKKSNFRRVEEEGMSADACLFWFNFKVANIFATEEEIEEIYNLLEREEWEDLSRVLDQVDKEDQEQLVIELMEYIERLEKLNYSKWR